MTNVPDRAGLKYCLDIRVSLTLGFGISFGVNDLFFRRTISIKSNFDWKSIIFTQITYEK